MEVKLVTAALLAAVLASTTAWMVSSRHAAAVEAALLRSRLTSDSLAAVNDTTRTLLRDARSQTMVVERRAVQATVRRDSLDAALRQAAKANQQLRVTLSQFRARADGTVMQDTSGVRAAHFDVRSSPFTVSADVVLPPTPDTGRFTVDVAVDPIPLSVRVTCAPDGPVSRASVRVTAPAWAPTVVDSAAQDARICNAPLLAPRPPSLATRARRAGAWALVGAVVGIVLTR